MRARVFVPLLVLAIFVGWWISPGRAFGVTGSQCEAAWAFPHGKVADACREAGWVIRRHLDVNPRREVILADMAHCHYEDGPGLCLWDGIEDGNGYGLSFWLNKGSERPHYVWTYDPATDGWTWVDGGLDMMLDQARRPRRWTACVTYDGWITCPWHYGVFPAFK